jgi:hypothetical protein
MPCRYMISAWVGSLVWARRIQSSALTNNTTDAVPLHDIRVGWFIGMGTAYTIFWIHMNHTDVRYMISAWVCSLVWARRIQFSRFT